MSKSKDESTELEAQIDDRLADQLDGADDELASELFGGTRLDLEREREREIGPTYEYAVAGRPLTFRASELLERGGRYE
jgi:hypothetical protein